MDKRRETEERVPSIRKDGSLNPNGIPVRRSEADQGDNPSAIVFATMPILGEKGDYITEFKRSPTRKDRLAGEWVPFLTEHKNVSDSNNYATLVRGVLGEVGYQIRPTRPIMRTSEEQTILHDEVYASMGIGKGTVITYSPTDGGGIKWVATPFVVPIQSLDQLKVGPDGEIVEVRKKPYREFLDEIIKEKFPGSFEPIDFLYNLAGATRHVFTRWPRKKT